MDNAIDIREIAACSCLRVRRTARGMTRLYDRTLEPAGLTVNQFGLLANLQGDAAGLSIRTLAGRLGMDPTTLNRDLKPLKAEGLVRDAADPGDRRVRLVLITAKGRARLTRAVPLWRRAQQGMEELLGRETMRRMNALLDGVWSRMAA